MRIKLNGGGRRRRKREEKKRRGEGEERAVRIFVTKLSTFSKQSVSRERQAGIPKETLPSRVCGRARARSRPLKCNDFLGRSRADRRPRFLREAGADSICAQTRRHTTVTCRNRDEKTKRLSSLLSPPHPRRGMGKRDRFASPLPPRLSFTPIVRIGNIVSLPSREGLFSFEESRSFGA